MVKAGHIGRLTMAEIAGAPGGPVFYGWLIGEGSNPGKLFIGYLIGAGVMVIGGLVEVFIGVAAEGSHAPMTRDWWHA